MADGTQGISSNMPFNVGSDIHAQTRTRERIETHLVEQRVEKAHRANHRHLEALQKQRLDLLQSYDRLGAKTEGPKPQGTNVNIEV
ncbi:MAG: hypothetical protein VW715_11305 [Rhodospirillales bacterium]